MASATSTNESRKVCQTQQSSRKRRHKETSRKAWKTSEDDKYYMGKAKKISKRSKDPITKVGACLVTKDGRIVGEGFNDKPDKCKDEDMPWEKGSTVDDNKRYYVCHAELNAIAHRSEFDVKTCKMYVTLSPCNECAKVIVQHGIDEVIYETLPDDKAKKHEYKASKILFEKTGTKYRKREPTNEEN